jgi:hypothetical protein
MVDMDDIHFHPTPNSNKKHNVSNNKTVKNLLVYNFSSFVSLFCEYFNMVCIFVVPSNVAITYSTKHERI